MRNREQSCVRLLTDPQRPRGALGKQPARFLWRGGEVEASRTYFSLYPVAATAVAVAEGRFFLSTFAVSEGKVAELICAAKYRDAR